LIQNYVTLKSIFLLAYRNSQLAALSFTNKIKKTLDDSSPTFSKVNVLLNHAQQKEEHINYGIIIKWRERWGRALI
jgi:hypothetical protein